MDAPDTSTQASAFHDPAVDERNQTQDRLGDAFDDAQLCPAFPPELERKILTMAFYGDEKMKYSLNLLLVAHRAFQWLIPLVFEVVMVHNAASWPPIQRFTPADIQRYGGYVRHLLVTSRTKSLPLYLPGCPNVTNLALVAFTRRYDNELLEALSNLPLKELSINASLLSNLPPKLITLFGTITHLDTAYFSRWSTAALDSLLYFTRVTHLMVLDDQDTDKVLDTIIKRMPRLKLLVIASYSDRGEITEVEPRMADLDSRVVSIQYDFLRHWKSAAQGLDSPWLFAENVVEKRKREERSATEEH
ncbi:hypothetical protein BDN72DRAFT_834179 [Pluteus cervinus]|uniref:Uncharacterized protein n=1 Tax=Pluteus cervinus TaxID=181527 RepID=A0ACD3B697_9AGAR|nr:hypothetical protein BDN72DRAFT_834179 [Pluteus cervinus]